MVSKAQLKAAERTPPIVVSANQLYLLAALDHGPNYGLALVKDNPRMFSTRSATDGSLVINGSLVYTRLNRLEGRGFIERATGFRPPQSAKISPRDKKKIVWWRLTAKGREVLAENRSFLQK